MCCIVWASLLDQWLRTHLPMQEVQVWSLGQGDPPGGGNGNPFQYSCRENPMNRGARQTTVHGVAKSQTRLSNWTKLKLNLYRSSPPSFRLLLQPNCTCFDWPISFQKLFCNSCMGCFFCNSGIFFSVPSMLTIMVGQKLTLRLWLFFFQLQCRCQLFSF